MPEKPSATVSISSSDRLGFTLFIALMLHALIVLGVSFTPSEKSQQRSLPSLDIILAQTKSDKAPEQVDFLAQLDQQGGGSSTEKAQPGAPMSANTPIDQDGFATKAQQAMTKSSSESSDKEFITQQEGDKKVVSNEQQKEVTTNKQQPRTQTQLKIAQLKAEIKKMRINYAKRPKTITLTAATKKAVEASYLSQWVKRIERIGNLNYPQSAIKQEINGSLRLNVTINSQGKVLNVRVSKTSGNSILDAAAKRIVKLAEPFQPFSTDLKKTADQIVIIRTWTFSSNQQQLETSS